MAELGINEAGNEACITSSDTDLLMYEHLNIAAEKGISGSPTTLINNEKYLGARDSNTLMRTVCERLLDPPEGCDQIISTSVDPVTGSC